MKNTVLHTKTTFSKSLNWILYIKNYEIQRKRCLSATYNNLYHYAGNNPVKYTDPDGRIQVSVASFHKMQDKRWGEDKVAGSTLSMSLTGCAIVSTSNAISSFRGMHINPDEINNDKFVTKGNLSFADVATEYGLKAEKVEGKFTRETWQKQHQSKDTFSTIINVNYNDDNDDHWVGVRGMTKQNGKNYFIIAASSENDSFMGKSQHSNRGGKGWKVQSNNILVPVDQVKGYVNFIKINKVEE